ncbi:TPA: hypothetical protein ACHW7I_002527 [Legionella pneumophila]|uniref:hypothetical protein n=1 Tax=Legionella pneumophila TaxID=446 RepID=UPI0002F5D37D|nr:hypothetical protein [Legionella pneumophila]MDW8877929.1 hypothetical protein [Legionella pneumophila subsp. fraseri]MCK1849103.1 hypothetical protein [Legionella pneumophila]MCZ4806882.1 hypothetical protein [Legionella pneumophila]MDI9852443.1 hypothetical protein [Legionella pneumophila]MDW8855237.1 hypothetical protein [Legionella pneumophila]
MPQTIEVNHLLCNLDDSSLEHFLAIYLAACSQLFLYSGRFSLMKQRTAIEIG